MSIIDTAREVATRILATRPDLHKQEEFPFDIWAEFGKAGLLGVAIPKEYGGQGLALEDVSSVAEALVRYGHNRGIVSSYLSHNMISAFMLVREGTDAQKKEWLPRIAAGDVTPSVAISEPDAGAHPKRLTSRAERDGKDYILNGEKAYLTNGPIAKLYIFLAITSVEDGRKRYSMFLTPRETEGLTQTDAGSVDYIRPSPHGGISLKGARVPAGAMLGTEGEAYETKAKPFREWEVAVGAGATTGAMLLGIDRLVSLLPSEVSPDTQMALGNLRALADGTRQLSFDAIADLANRLMSDEPQGLLIASGAIQAAFRDGLHALRQDLPADDLLDRFWPAPSAAGGGARGQVDRANLIKLGALAIEDAKA